VTVAPLCIGVSAANTARALRTTAGTVLVRLGRLSARSNSDVYAPI